jgi:hypothetical protein
MCTFYYPITHNLWVSPGKVKVKFTLEQAIKGERGVDLELYSFFNLGARWERVFNATPRPLYPTEREPVTIVQQTGWVSVQVWTGAENLAPPTGNRFPDHPARSE